MNLVTHIFMLLPAFTFCLKAYMQATPLDLPINTLGETQGELGHLLEKGTGHLRKLHDNF